MDFLTAAVKSEWPALAASALWLCRRQVQTLIDRIKSAKVTKDGVDLTLEGNVLAKAETAVLKVAESAKNEDRILGADSEHAAEGVPKIAYDGYKPVTGPQVTQGMPSDFQKNVAVAQVGILMASTRQRLAELEARVGDNSPNLMTNRLLTQYLENYLLGLSRIVLGKELAPDIFLSRIHTSFDVAAAYALISDVKSGGMNALASPPLTLERWQLLIKSANTMISEVANATIEYISASGAKASIEGQ